MCEHKRRVITGLEIDTMTGRSTAVECHCKDCDRKFHIPWTKATEPEKALAHQRHLINIRFIGAV